MESSEDDEVLLLRVAEVASFVDVMSIHLFSCSLTYDQLDSPLMSTNETRKSFSFVDHLST